MIRKQAIEPGEWLPVATVARELNVTTTYIYELIEDGSITRDEVDLRDTKKTTRKRISQRALDRLRERQASGLPLCGR